MLIKDTILGQRIVISVDSNNLPLAKMKPGFISHCLVATAIFRAQAAFRMTMLGWKKDEVRTMNSSALTYVPTPGATAANIRNYTHYEWIPNDFECELDEVPTLRSIPIADSIVKTRPAMSFGHTCSKCDEHYKDAMHDSSTKFVCTQCKMRAKMWG